MPPFQTHQTVGQIVAAAPATARVFERLGIDYCCGGKVTLADASAAKGLAPLAVMAELEHECAARPSDRSWDGATPSEVIEHLLSTHHEFVKREIPRLSALMEKVNRVHGPRHPEVLPAMAQAWQELAGDLSQHLLKEEQILFPAIQAIGAGRPTGMPPAWIEAPIGVMEQEHEIAGRLVARLRGLAGGYRVPEDACGSWRALWAGLDEFEQDLHRHIHLENEVLHPAARRLAGLA